MLTLCVPVLVPPMAVAGQATTPTRESWSPPQTPLGAPGPAGDMVEHHQDAAAAAH